MLTEPLPPCSAAPLGKPNGGVLQSDRLPRQCISDDCCCVVSCVVCWSCAGPTRTARGWMYGEKEREAQDGSEFAWAVSLMTRESVEVLLISSVFQSGMIDR